MGKRLIFTKWLKAQGVDVKRFVKQIRKEKYYENYSSSDCCFWVGQAFDWCKAIDEGFKPPRANSWLTIGERWRKAVTEHQEKYGEDAEILFAPNCPTFDSLTGNATRVFHGKRDTVLVWNGKRVVASCQKGDRYSRFAGLAAAAMKMAGMSYEEIAKAFEESNKNAYRPKQKGA